MLHAGLLTESRGKAGDATYTRVEQLIESDANRAAGRETSASLAPENEPPLASVQDIIRQVKFLYSASGLQAAERVCAY